MPVVATVQLGTVTNVWGTAVLRLANGKTRPIKIGDVINHGDVILTAQNSIVEIRKPDTGTLVAADPRTPPESIDQIITGLERGDPDVVPAAGGGSSGEYEPAIRVGRISEGTGSGSLEIPGLATDRRSVGEFPTDANPAGATPAAPAPAPAPNQPPVAVVTPASGAEDAARIPLNLSGTDVEDGRAASVTVTALPPASQGRLFLNDGTTPVVAGQPLTADQAASLVFVPAPDFNGTVNVGFVVADSQGLSSGPATAVIQVTPVNDPPVAIVVPASGAEDAPIPLRLGGSDPDGSVTGITITTIPPGARLTLADGTPVTAGQTLTPTQAASLVFTPPANFNGSTAVGFTVTDNQGATSAPASVPITVTPVNDPPVARPDVAGTSEDVAAQGNVILGLGGAGVDTDADNDTLTVTAVSFGGVPGAVGAAIAGAFGSLVLNADGSYVYTPGPAAQALAAGASATDAFSYTVSDGNGGSSTTTLTISLTGVNDPPNARDDLASTPINVPITVPVLANDSDPDSSPLVVTTAALANPAQGTVAINPDGTLAFTPATNVTGPVTLTYTVRDADGATDTANVTVFIGPNTPPDSADLRLAGTEDTPLVLTPANFAFTDADAGQSLAAVRVDVLPAAGRLLLDGQPIAAGNVINLADLAAGRLAFQPAPNASGSGYASFDFSVQDSFGAFDTTPNRITIDIGAVNDAPIAVNDAGTTPEDTAISFTPAALLGNDVDVDGDPLTVTSVQGAMNGTVAIVGGNVVFTPAANYNGPASFTYTISDGQGGTSTATVNLTVTPVNDPPVAVNDAGTTPEDTPVTLSPAALLANDTDADGNPLTITSVQSPVNGTVALVGGNVVFTPAANYNGPASFAYTVSDGQGGTSTATVNLTVTPVNDPPVAANDAGTTPEDTPITIAPATLLGNDVDADGDPLTITSVQGAVNGTVALVAGNVVFTPAANYNGPASFTYTVSDGQGGTSTATVNLSVSPVNDPPVAANDSGTTPEDTPVSFTPAALLGNDTDPEGNPLTIASMQGAVNGSVAIVAGNVVFTPAANYNGPASFTYTISDGLGGTSTATVNLTVTPVNDPPVAVNDSDTTPEDTPITIAPATLLGNDTDVEGNPLTITSVQAPVNGTVALVGGNVVFTPAANYNGPASFTYTISDSQGGTSTATVNLTVTPVNDPPVAVNDAGTTPEDTPVSFAPAALLGNDTDVDGNPLSITSVQSAVNGTVAIVAGNVVFTPAANYNGPASFTYTIGDGQGGSSTATVNLTVTPVNDPPVAVNDTGTTPEDTPLTIAPATLLGNDTDVDGNPLTITSVQGAVNGTVAIVAGNVVFTPAADYNGPASFTYTISDGQGGTSTATVDLTVTPAPDAPVNTVPAAQTTAEDSPLVFSAANGNALGVADADGGSLTVTVAVTNGRFTLGSTAGVGVTGNGSGSVQITGTAAAINAALAGSSYAATADYHGAASLTLTTSDGTASDVDTVALTVTPVVDIAADAVTTPEDTAVAISVLANDSFENAGRTISAVNGTAIVAGGAAVAVANGSVALNASSQLVFTPALNYNGPASFTYTVASGGVSETATVDVTVTPVNDAPVANPNTATTPEDTPVSGNVLTNDTDPDGTALTVTSFTVGGTTYAAGTSAALAGVGTLTIASTGAYTFTPAANYNGPVPTATYVASDGALTASSTLAITITPVNDAPVATPDMGTTFESVPLTGNVLTNDSDVDGQALSVTQFVVGGSTYLAGATATLAGVGTLTIGGTGAYTFTPVASYNGPVPVATYTASDGAATASSTLAISITPVNNAAEPTLAVRGIGRWTFDEGSGTTTRDTYNARTGTLDDTVTAPATVRPVWTSGHVGTSGTALDFDGSGSRVALDAATTQPLMGTSTLSFWVRTTQTGAGNSSTWDSPAVIASEQAGGQNDIQWGAINASGQIGLGIGDVPGVFSSTVVNDGAWHQVAITRDASNNVVNVYVDGRLETTGTTIDPNFLAAPNRLAGFGQNNNFGLDAAATDLTDLDFFRGQLDDLRIYDRVLTADQVRAIQLVESGYHDTAIANDGSPMRIGLTASDFTSLTVQGLEAGMTITDGTRSVTSTGPDTVVSLTGWTLGNLSLTGSGAATLAFDASNTVAGETRATTTQYLNIVTGTSLLGGTSAADTLTGGASADLLSGGLGADTLAGAAGNDRLNGGAGADSLNGGAGRDVLIGGAGNDSMTGGAGADVFAWNLADRGAAGGPAVDTILDFDMASASAGGDRLDLRDLLQGSNYVGTDPGNLQNFLDFNVVGGNTEIRISSSGGFAGGSYAAGAEDQRIVLSGVDIRSSLGLGSGASDNQIIQELLNRGKLAGTAGRDGGAFGRLASEKNWRLNTRSAAVEGRCRAGKALSLTTASAR